MACVHHQEDATVFDNNYTEFAEYAEFAEFAYRGALLLKRERMEINAPNANTNSDDNYLKPASLKSPKIEQVESKATSIDPNSQKRFEKMGTMNEKKRKRSESDAIFNALIECRLGEGRAVSPHVEKMIGFFQSLEKLGFHISRELSIGITLGTLPDEYHPFIRNFYRRDFDKTLNQLHQMLKSFEIDIRKASPPTRNKCKATGDAQIKNPQPKSAAKTHDLCNYCNQLGHWKRNCKKYLEDRKKGDRNLL